MAWTTPATATAGSTALTAAFWNEQVRDNLVELAPFTAAWTSFTPSWSNVTVGNGTNTGGYIRVGKLVSYWAKFVLGSTSAITATPVLTLPVAAKSSQIGCHNGLFEDSGTGYFLIMPRVAGPTVECYAGGAGGTYVGANVLNATVPFTWTTNDIIWISGIYESA